MLTYHDALQIFEKSNHVLLNNLDILSDISDIKNRNINYFRLHLKDDSSGYYEYLYVTNDEEGESSKLELYKKNGEKIGIFISDNTLADLYSFIKNRLQRSRMIFRYKENIQSNELLYRIEFQRSVETGELTYQIFQQINHDFNIEISHGIVDSYKMFKKTDDEVLSLKEEDI